VRFANSRTRYGLIARVLHWTSVALLGAVVIMGSGLETAAGSVEHTRQVERHAILGAALLAIMVLRIVWRLHNPNPLDAYSMSRWARFLALTTHWFLYAAIFLQCAIGISQAAIAWLVAGTLSMTPNDTVVLGPGIPVGVLIDIHQRLSAVILTAVGLHVAGALRHQLFGLVEDELIP